MSDRGVALKLYCARVRDLYEVVPEPLHRSIPARISSRFIATSAQHTRNRAADEPYGARYYNSMRSPPGEYGVDGEGVIHRGHAHQIPGEAEVGPVDVDLGG